MGLVLLLGGARSGKSRLAVRLASAWSGRVVVIATAEAGDEEMAERIRRHRAERAPEWETVEEPVDLEGALAGVPQQAGVLLDCLTLWVSNLMERGLSDADIEDRARKVAALAASRRAETVAVSNEVGAGIVPVNALARRYTDILGRVNVIWAEAAESAVLVVAGRAVRLSDPDEVMGGPLDG